MFKFNRFCLAMLLFLFSYVASHAESPAVQPSAAVEVYSGKQNDEWVQYQSELDQIRIKLEAQKSIVNELFAHKKSNESKLTPTEVEQINKHDQTLKDLQKEYDAKLRIFETKFPEKGQTVGRKYNRKNQNSSSAEKDSNGAKGQLKKLNKKLEEQYESATQVPKTPQKNETKTKAPPKKMNDGVSDKIILVK